MPTTATLTFSAQKLEPAIAPQMAVEDAGPLASGTYSRGQLLEISAGVYQEYSSGDAAAICMYDCVSDGTNVTLTGGTSAEWGATRRTAPIYLAGYFRMEELVGLDAGAIADLGRVVRGASPSGILRVY